MRSHPLVGAAVLATAGALLIAPEALAAPVPPSVRTGPAHGTAAGHGHPHGPDRPVGRIEVEGTVNFRDLGGYRTFSGARVEAGLVYRAEALNHLTDAGLAALAGLGIERVVDFRTPLEVAQDGPDRLPAGLAATRRPVGDTGMYAAVTAAIGSKDPARQQAVLGAGRGEEIMRTLYRSFVTDPESRAAFGRTLRELADGSSRPLVFHCTSGKDRTGWLAYLLLRSLGVPEATARRDFLLSNQYRAAADARTREGLKAGGYMRDPDLLIPVQEVRPGYLDAALDQVRRSYGSVDRYLRLGLGVDGRTRARLWRDLLAR
ncbi:tyrosine-protein phosphatase [Actinomadura bangladeshensis]|uniref:Tyrosine-protein phosphatase n=1 Tax=Actinomadura bangladeshensis TaxID=453573 RepID=A0A6L9QCK5_9ACTN|nr:tyrosine-protein phosphatase [Actinomadura bangladeshensis]NEA22832.1 tyrosine-protein phosphatase [Actinomadura bangladeshensis]